MAGKLGFKAVAYFLSTGTRATWGTHDSDDVAEGVAPTGLTEMGNIKDLTINLSKGESDATTRKNKGWEATLPTLKSGQLQFQMQWDPADASFAAVFKAWSTDSTIAIAALDGDKATVGTEGLWADFAVIGFEKSEPLKEAQSVSVTLKPAYADVAPEWVRVAAA